METAPANAQHDLLSQIRHATDDVQRLEPLRALKTIILGNDLRKEELVRDNGLELLNTLLQSRSHGKPAAAYTQEQLDDIVGRSVVSAEDSVAMHAADILGMLANGGSPFVYPIFAAGCIPLLLSMLAYPVPSLRLAVLESLTSIADSLPVDYERAWPAGKQLATLAFSRPYVAYLVDVLRCNPKQSKQARSKRPRDTTATRCFKLAADLISRLCLDDHSKITLACSGAVDALSCKVASFVVAQGLVLPGAERFAKRIGALGYIPAPTREDSSVLAATLSALNVIISGSRGRAEHFLSSPALVTVFPPQACKNALASSAPGPGKVGVSHAAAAPAWGGAAWTPALNRCASWDCRYPNPLDALLPPFKFDDPPDSSFPSLTSAAEMQASLNLNKEEFEGPASDLLKEVKEESPFVSWLIYTVFTGFPASADSTTGGSREIKILAATLLIELFELRLVKDMRIPALTTLVTPILINIMEGGFKFSKTRQDPTAAGDFSSTQSRLKVDAISMLARLIKSLRDREGAHARVNQEPNIVKSVVRGLQRTFVPEKETARPTWSPYGGDADGDTPSNPRLRLTDSPTAIGPSDLSKHVVWQLRAREKYLVAMTNLALYSEEVRAQLAERETLNCILNSMKAPDVGGSQGDQSALGLRDELQTQYQQEQQQHDRSQRVNGSTSDDPSLSAAGGNAACTGQTLEADHNSIGVIHAACMAARALCRSPKLMRTHLKEAEMSKPVIKLLTHPDADIKLAATAVLCNLSLDFSPMKVHVMETTALSMLCAQARSSNVKLQIDSLWALKHIVLEQSNQFRMMILNELGINAILNAMSYESRELITHRDTGEAVSECANILSFCDSQDFAAPVATQEFDEQSQTGVSTATVRAMQPVIRRMSRSEKLQLDADLEYIKQMRKDKAELIEQSIDLVRNLICGGDDCPIVLDHIIAQCGTERLCSLLTQRLDDYTLRSNVYGPQFIPAPEQVVLTISYALINISACAPAHADMIISHGRLMQLIVKMLNHHMRRVRCNATWTLNNLVSSAKADDIEGCRRRARLVANMGVEETLSELQREDKDVDVRERARQVVKGLKDMLGSQHTGVNGNVANGTWTGGAVNGTATNGSNTDIDMEL